MRKLLILCVLFFGITGFAFAQEDILTIKPSSEILLQTLNGEEVKREAIYELFAEIANTQVRTSYSSIALQFKDVKKGTSTYSNLQKLVYLDILPNKPSSVLPNKSLNAYVFYTLAEKILNTDLIGDSKELISALKKRNTYTSDINFITHTFNDLNQEDNEEEETISSESDEIAEKKEMFFDVYETLKKEHYNKDTISEKDMLYGAIQGLAEGTKDKFTSFFPPTQNKSFQDGLSGNYEGIGAYVDMVKSGEVLIVSPIVDGPAFRAGIKAGDIITSVENKKIETENSLSEVVSWIKGPAGSTVKLDITRGSEKLQINVKRDKITIKEVEYKTYKGNTFYLQIKGFGDNTFSDFTKAIGELKKTNGITKLIIDVRNNPGGYLDVVNEMLGYFVPEGEGVSIIKYHNYTLENKSSGYTDINFGNYQIIILENGGTASASEILVGTIKDYFPKAIIIGENSYGKGSVQTLKSYQDGSSLKYTIAKWYTGKTETGIDGVGIKPDLEVKITDEDIKNQLDSQLEAALKY